MGSAMFQILAKVTSSVVSGVDTGYAGSNGLEPQQFVSNNSPCGYICYGFGEFDGQGSGHDFSGNVRYPLSFLCPFPRARQFASTAGGDRHSLKSLLLNSFQRLAVL